MNRFYIIYLPGIFSRFCIHLTGNYLFCKFFPRQFSSLLIQNIQLTWKGTLHSLRQCISTFALGMSCYSIIFGKIQQQFIRFSFVFINHLRPSLIGLRTVMQGKSCSNSCQKHYHSSCSKSRLSPSFRCFYLLFFLLDCCTVRTKRSVVRKRLSAFYTFFTHIFLLLRYIYG